MKWISVKDKLPPTIPNDGYLILISDGYHVSEGFLEEDISNIVRDETSLFSDESSNDPNNDSCPYRFRIIGQEKCDGRPFITHWMPLPPPPKKGKK